MKDSSVEWNWSSSAVAVDGGGNRCKRELEACRLLDDRVVEPVENASDERAVNKPQREAPVPIAPAAVNNKELDGFFSSAFIPALACRRDRGSWRRGGRGSSSA